MTIGRRTALAAAATALVTGTAPAARAARQDGPLQRDADAVRATGATGVLAEVRTARGRAAARSGVADLTTGDPVPWDAYYRIGSDTKTFTAALVLQLAHERRVSLTDTVERWLPGLVHGNGNDGRRITLVNLLRHTSGLNEYAEFGDFTPEAYRAARFRPSDPPDRQVAAALRRPPGWLPRRDDPAEERRWGYSNTDYVLLGMVLEKATGHSWAELLHDRILEPLGLRHTFTPGSSPYVPRPTATAYTEFPGSPRPVDTSLAAGGWADGGIVSTPRDLAAFLSALMGGRLLPAAQLAAMRRTVPAEGWIAAPGVRYGLGIAWRPVPGSRSGIWFHGGTHLGTVSESGVTPDGDRAVATAVFTLRTDPKGREAQARAALRLVDRALVRRD
ncbi:serine hydrolase domain-containing protein [Streptomyces sp. 769]|uniref:serine hydrolase domain-containing protein n=1 Tax=Streptomyces sp. 769 TaxID=1262452 RepID=UPI00057EE3E0|nr:serine hydrolase domain-containing protein [Streptomyces sp. 769]AJC54163.1 dipeptidyl carboxypeptidase [Streptomyces sp. 769]